MTRLVVFQFLALLSSFLSSRAVDVHGAIRWNEVCSGIDKLGQAKVVLDNGVYAGSVTRDGSFVIPDVAPGTYILSVLAHDFTFDNVRLDIANSTATPEARPYVSGTPFNPPSQVLLPAPLLLVPRYKHAYFTQPGSFNLLSMFSNPMMLFVVITACIALGMPYIMKNMDPEMLREIKERQEGPRPSGNASGPTQPKLEGPQKLANVAQGKVGGAKKGHKKK